MKINIKNQSLVMVNFSRIGLCISVLASALALQGCGGNGAGAAGNALPTTGSSTTAATSKATEVVMLTSAPNLPSDGKLTSTITVLVKDAGNRALADAVVDVTTKDSGVVLQQIGTKTGADGSVTAKVTLTSKINRVVQVTANVGTLTSTVDIPVTGTTVAVNGPQSLTFGGTGDFSLAVKDSSGNAVANSDVVVKSSTGNTISPTTVKTDANGQAKFQVNVTKNGTDTVSAISAGGSASVAIAVAATQLSLTGIATAEEVIVNATKSIGVLMTNNGAPVIGRTLRLTATRGTIVTPGGGNTVTTDSSGRATFTITSPNAGQSSVRVTDATSGGAATSSIEFISTTPAVVKIQAAKPVLAANAIGSSGSTSDLIATVKDSFGNPVKGVVVDFSAVTDPSNGRIDPPSAVTDVAGNASVAFIAGPTVTGPDQVELRATVAGTSVPESKAKLTVASRQVSIRLGTGNRILSPDLTKYSFPWTAVVVDSSGAPIQNATVTVQVVPVGYYKGSWFKPLAPAVGGWQRVAFETDTDGKYVTTAGGSLVEAPVALCPSEDTSPRDGELQAIEDINGSGLLEPGNVATSDVEPAGKPTGANGFVDFSILYAKSFAEFARIRIDVRVKVDGTENLVSQTFTLPISAEDSLLTAPPSIPGSNSNAGPFGRIVNDQIKADGFNIANGAIVKACSNPR
jgi:Bacterial Ig-like domain (group 1)